MPKTARRARRARKPDVSCRPPNLALSKRRGITDKEARELMGLFKVLANDNRLRMIQVLARAGKMRVTDLAKKMGMKPQAISNQLQRLVDKDILGSARNGNNIYYHIVDPCVPNLLESGLCLLKNAAI